jgi:HEAT repeat protein
MALPLFQSNLHDSLGKLARGEFDSAEEREALLAIVYEAKTLKPKEVVWLAFRPDRSLREASVRVLRRLRTTATINQFVVESKGKPEASLRAAAEILFGLKIPKIEHHLKALLTHEDEAIRESTSRLVLVAPPSDSLEAIFWRLLDSGPGVDRSQFLDRLATMDPRPETLPRWLRLADSDESEVRATALRFLADNCAEEAVDRIVDNLPRVDYATQQHLITALSRVARGLGPEFVEQLLPLMASGEAGTRSAVIKVLLSMDDRHELVKRYLKFSKTLAGWARDRALDSMKEFGHDLIEPTIELLSDPDEEVRALALVVAGSFDDPRIIPATILSVGSKTLPRSMPWSRLSTTRRRAGRPSRHWVESATAGLCSLWRNCSPIPHPRFASRFSSPCEIFTTPTSSKRCGDSPPTIPTASFGDALWRSLKRWQNATIHRSRTLKSCAPEHSRSRRVKTNRSCTHFWSKPATSGHLTSTCRWDDHR